MAEDQSAELLRIDIISDVVCPWCIIGFKQLEQALSESGTEAGVHWHPFELNPQMAPEGENLREHVAAKYGTTAESSEQARASMTALGKVLGFTFNYADDMRMWNTFRAHRLLYWAASKEQQHQLKMALFGAFFTERRNVDDPGVLADTAALIGLDREEARAVLSEERFAQEVRKEEAFWTSQGITGVPAMIFDQRYLLVGAQGAENYRRVLDKLAEERAA